MRDKFTNQQLYQWMASRLSGTYFQTYRMAHDMARYAEQAYRYERGEPERGVAFIQPTYWDSQRKGLMAGDGLGLDIDRMEQAFIESIPKGSGARWAGGQDIAAEGVWRWVTGPEAGIQFWIWLLKTNNF